MNTENKAASPASSASRCYLDVQSVLDAIDCEEEFDGEIPDNVWNKASQDRQHLAEFLREAVRLTKRNIRNRIKDLPSR